MKLLSLDRIRQSRKARVLSMGLSMTLLFEIAFPSISLALTSGPGQPEYSSFEPASTSDMVDVYSGSFTYNIPLLSIPGPNGGYPLNLAYQSGISMDQEASWVGLGWVLNVGAINRQLQGIPDDFKDEAMSYKVNQKKTWSVSMDLPIPPKNHNEIAGAPAPPASAPPSWTFSTQLYYNNYRGLGYRVGVNYCKVEKLENGGVKTSPASLSLSFDSQNGIGINPSVSIGSKMQAGLSASYNSRTGLNGINFSMSPNFLASSKVKKKLNKASKKFESAAIVQALKGLGYGSVVQAIKQTYMAQSSIAFYPSSSSLNFSFGGHMTNIGIETKSHYYPFTVRALGSENLWPVFKSSYPLSIWSGMYSRTDITHPEYTDRAYGYLYSQDGFTASASADNIARDFTKKDIAYSKKVPNLSPSKSSYDIFTFSGQGTGGFFRPYNTGVDVYAEKTKSSVSVTNELTGEFGTGTSGALTNLHIGIGYNRNKGTNTEGDWQDLSTASDFNITSSKQTKMKLAGEHTGVLVNDDLLNSHWGGEQAVRNDISPKTPDTYIGREYKINSNLVYYQGSANSGDLAVDGNLKYKRLQDNRNTSVRYLTNDEAGAFGYSKNLSYKSFTRPGHHISEVIVTQPEGSKYVYGLPVYNETQSEYSYNVNNTYSATSSIISATDDGSENFNLASGLGVDYSQYYQKSTTQPYAYSWLLTGVMGNDYIDVDQNGISDDDKGYWVKFTYTKSADDFKWRVPYSGAKLSENAHGNEYDNVASFTYGTKDIYYVTQIETKTHVAYFDLEDREDGLSAYDVFDPVTPGTRAPQKRLKTIRLYSKNDPATPLQVVHFEYDYSLCPGVPNNSTSGNGKLTLKKVYFTYEKSNKGALSPYEFTYSSNNPSYNQLAVDRWGDYKNITTSAGDPYPFERFPYTEQKNPPLADAWHLTNIHLPTGGELNIQYEPNDYAYVEDQRAMEMFDIVGVGNDIDGSEIIKGTRLGDPSSKAWYDQPRNSGSLVTTYPTRSITTNSETYSKIENEGPDNAYRIYFELDKTYSTSTYNTASTRADLVKNKFLQNTSKIWFKNLTTLKDNGSGTYDDYVEGYVDIQYTIATGKTVGDYFGLCKSTSGAAGYDVGYFTVVREPLQENGLGWSKANPMTKLAIQHMRMNRDDINYSAYPTLPDSDPFSVFSGFLLTIPGYVVEVASMIASYNVVQFSLGNCKFIRLDGHSKVRLYDEDGRKYGGGARVRQLSIEDNWAAGSAAVSGEEGIYGQKYIYNMSGIDGDDNSISSGVAYEPFIGAEESALRQPVDYSQSTPLRSAYSLFVEKPVLDFYYPGASVGYRKVTVYSLGKDHATTEAGSIAVNHNAAAPATIYEFYTPKDFPIYSDETDLNPEQTHLVPVIVPGIYTYYEAKKARSQGYSIVLNDMAGKLRKTSQVKVANDNTPTGGLISSVEYVYNTALPFNEEGGNKLSSQVQAVIPTSGLEPQIETAVLGQTVDIHQERHESRYTDIGYGLEGNLDISYGGIVFLLAPSAFPSFSQTETSMKTVTMQKVIHSSGILMKTIAKTDQSVIESENLGFDLFTGEPILTRTNNEYDDKVYTFSYPGHWYYDHLKAVQQNDYLVMNGLSITVGSAGEVVLPTGFDYSVSNFAVGDEVYLTTSGSTGPPPSNHLAHVTKVDVGANKIWLMDKDGYYLNSGVLITQIKLRNSGLKNMQADKVGAISFKKLSGYTTAYLDNTSPSPLSFDEIINASALEYSDYWQSDCSTCTSREGGSGSGDVVNPFLEGIRNQWRPKKTYAYKTKRVYNGNSRTEGYLADYSRFKWENPSTSSASWILGNTITKYSPFGFELENKDALGNFSSAHYGYQNALMVSLASNSRYQENASDNFEDYYAGKDCFGDRMLTCAIPSVDESVISTIITNNDHHTGHYALWPHGSYTDIPFQGKVGSLTGCDDRNDSTQAPVLKTVPVGETGQAAFEKSDCDCLGGMKLKESGTYVFSAWTKVSKDWSSTGKPYTYSEPEVVIDFFDSGGTAISGSSVSITPNTRNKIIEGWQRLYKEFQVPSGAASFKVTFKKGTSDAGTNVYYDDMRIHPFDGNMVTYVFDVNNLKLLSELDENNYATFYNYDEEGNLINLKKETIEGIKTISEGRKELQKQ